MDFELGDVVVLKSGGPPMTVQELDSTSARCVWFVNAKKEVSVFHKTNLKKVEPI